MGNGYGRIAEYTYRNLTSNAYNPAAELNIANVLDYHSNGGYGGQTQWREWNTETRGHSPYGNPPLGWWWGYEAAPYDNLAAIACEFARPVVLAGVELGIKDGDGKAHATIYAWVDNDWLAVSDSIQIDGTLKIVYAHTFPTTTRMRVVSVGGPTYANLWNVNSHPRIFIYK